MTKRTREVESEPECPILVNDIIGVIFSQMVNDPIALLKLLKCSKRMLFILEPLLTEIVTNFNLIITSRIENAGWNGIDFASQPPFFSAVRDFLENSHLTNYRHLQTISSKVATGCRDTTVLLLSVMKRAILEDRHLFTKSPGEKRENRFACALHPDTRLKNIYWLHPSGKSCRPILDCDVRTAPRLNQKLDDYDKLVSKSIQKETCPIQRELLGCFYKYAKPKTVWEKMRTIFTLTSNSQKIRKPKKEDCISRVVIPSKSARSQIYTHIEPVLSQYFLHLGSQEEADFAVKLNYERSFILSEIANLVAHFAKKPPVIDLTL